MCLERVERSMADSWVERPLQPLRLSVPDFEVMRLRAVKRAAELAEIAGHSGTQATRARRTGSALWTVSADGLVGGYIDLVVEEPRGLVVRDFKTGLLLEPDEHGRVKSSYEVQLKLYAALYMNSFGRWPDHLELVPLSGAPVPIPFTHEECLSLLRIATALLCEVSKRVQAAQQSAGADDLVPLARPEPATCQFCLFRPACPAYRDARIARASERWPNDVLGQLLELRALGNGRLTIAVDDQARQEVTRLRGVDPDPERHPALTSLKEGCTIAVSSVRPSTSPASFSELSATTIYVIQLEEEAGPELPPET